MDARLSIYTYGHVPWSVTCRATSPAGAIPQQEGARLNTPPIDKLSVLVAVDVRTGPRWLGVVCAVTIASRTLEIQ